MANNAVRTVWECYGHAKCGTALVMAESREHARMRCHRWLGWDKIEAFRTPELVPLYVRVGGHPDTPVVFSVDSRHWEVVRSPKSGSPESKVLSPVEVEYKS